MKAHNAVTAQEEQRYTTGPAADCKRAQYVDINVSGILVGIDKNPAFFLDLGHPGK